MTKSQMFRTAHRNTREAIKEDSTLNYRVQFGLELSQLYSKKEMTLKEKADFLMRLEVRTSKVFKQDEKIDEMMDSLFTFLEEDNDIEEIPSFLVNDINKCYDFYQNNK